MKNFLAKIKSWQFGLIGLVSYLILTYTLIGDIITDFDYDVRYGYDVSFYIIFPIVVWFPPIISVIFLMLGRAEKYRTLTRTVCVITGIITSVLGLLSFSGLGFIPGMLFAFAGFKRLGEKDNIKKI